MTAPTRVTNNAFVPATHAMKDAFLTLSAMKASFIALAAAHE
jgi:hypothetical protein